MIRDVETIRAPRATQPGAATIRCTELQAVEVGGLLVEALFSYEVPPDGLKCVRPPAMAVAEAVGA